MATVIARETMSKAGMENRPGSRRIERRRRLARPIFGAAGTDITDELPSKHHNTERPRRPQRLRLRTRFLVSGLLVLCDLSLLWIFCILRGTSSRRSLHRGREPMGGAQQRGFISLRHRHLVHHTPAEQHDRTVASERNF